MSIALPSHSVASLITSLKNVWPLHLATEKMFVNTRIQTAFFLSHHLSLVQSQIKSDQKAFLGSLKFVRFALVVLVSICKNYGT